MRYPVLRNFAFVFICQRGRLEIESLLLAASLKRFLRGEFELIAAVPTSIELLGEPRPTTLELLRRLGVRIAKVCNEILEETPSREVPYLLTNKIFSLRVTTTAEKLVVLDSDQIGRREFLPAPHLRAPLSARRADFVSSRDVGTAWEQVFQAAGAELPSLRIRVPAPPDEAGADVYAPPSFNSSFVAIDAALAADFSRLWEDCFRRIDRAGALDQARYYQEQASLAVAAHKSQIAYEMLDLQHINPCLAHYIRPQRVQTDPQLLEVARSLVRELTGIDEIIRDQPDWHFLLT
ncbi:MAG TPA: hypothetical protein VMV10_16455 [Pirellulales bacterium]|nr:hypothetical protein [Pirellulales bacterium]